MRTSATLPPCKMFLLFFIVSISGVGGYDDRLMTVDYTYSPDEQGRTVMLECCTNGIGTRSGEVPDYKWQRYLGEPDISAAAVGINSHTLFIPNFTATDVGLYRCKISGFTTRVSAYIGVGGTNVAIAPGTISYNSDRSHLDCIESNYAPFSSFNYIFYRHHAPMPSQAYIDRRSLYVPGFNDDDIGIYSCVVFNAAGISYGDPYEWYIDYPYDPPPDPTITLNAPEEDLKTGTIMTLTCCSDGIPPPQYAWNKVNMITYAPEPLTNAVGVFSSTLYVPIAGVSDSGVYICTAFNSDGTSFAETLVDLSPEGPPYFLTVSSSPVYISQYQQRHIDCVAAGDPYPTLSWTRVNGTLPPYTTWNHAGMTLIALEGSDVSGVYVCSATNINGYAERVFEVFYTSSITEAPTTAPTTVATEPQDPPANVTVRGESAVVEGGDLILNCSADGDPQPTYQWLRSGSGLPDKVADPSSPQLVVPSMTWADVGVYYCLAVNAGGVSYSPAVYALLQAEEGAVISYRREEGRSVDADLLGGVFGGVVAVLVVVSLVLAGLFWYMSRPVKHALEEPPTVWDVLVGQHKDKNMFDLIVNVQRHSQQEEEEDTTREPSLSSHIMRNLNVTSRIDRPFGDHSEADGLTSGVDAETAEVDVCVEDTSLMRSGGEGVGENSC